MEDDFYERITSKDGKRTWLKTETRQAYKSPGVYRQVEFDEKGQVEWVEITDPQKQQRQLTLGSRRRRKQSSGISLSTAQIRTGRSNGSRRDEGCQLAMGGNAQRPPKGTVNVFRHSMRDEANGRDWSYDFWIDQKTKRLVESHVPGADIFDPEKDPDRNNPPEEEWSRNVSLVTPSMTSFSTRSWTIRCSA